MTVKGLKYKGAWLWRKKFGHDRVLGLIQGNWVGFHQKISRVQVVSWFGNTSPSWEILQAVST